MTIADDALLAETFLRAHLATPTDDDFVVTVKRVEHDGDRTLTTVFGVSIPFTAGDMRPAERINGCLRAMMSAHPSLRTYRVEVTADTIDAT
jgi:hypothetical protein